MPPSFTSQQSQLSTELLPTLPTVEEMRIWGRSKVLQWIRQRDPSLIDDDNDVERFLNAGISGSSFLNLDFDFLREVCGFSPGMSRQLIQYMNEVVQSGHALSPKGKRKRNGETAAPESTTSKSLKRRRQEQEQKDDHDSNDADIYTRRRNILLNEELENTRKRRKAIEKILTDLNKEYFKQHSQSPYSEYELPGAVALLSDPERQYELPFPVTYMEPPSRFAVTQEDNWRYVGREKFPELLRELRFIRTRKSYKQLWVYGTRGYGKSHLLAALVCYLSALGECVTYIPDCRNWLNKPVAYFKAALLFAFTDEAVQDEILTLETIREINGFLDQYKGVHFVIDQMNALNAKAGDQENIRLAKINLSDWISSLISERRAVLSSSANNQDFLIQQNQQNYNHVMRVYGGLTETEMKAWWSRHSRLDLGSSCKEEIENLTGCILLLLNECVVNEKIDLSPLKKVGDKATAFTDEIREKTKITGNQGHWNKHCEFVKACFFNLPVPTIVFQTPSLIDHRFFFQREDGTGGYACGVARRAVAEALVENQQYFSDSNFLKALPTFYNNPSTTGFFMEYAVLFYLQLHGLPDSHYLANHMEVISFKTAVPNIRKDIIGRPVVYHPVDYDYEILDGFIVYIKEAANGQKPDLLLYPYQVTLHRSNHKDSHAAFFDDYDKWVEDLEEFNVVTEFLWFSADKSTHDEHQAARPSEGMKRRSGNAHHIPGRPKHIERVVNFGDLDKDLGVKFEKAQKKGKEEKADQKALQKALKKAKQAAAKAKKTGQKRRGRKAKNKGRRIRSG